MRSKTETEAVAQLQTGKNGAQHLNGNHANGNHANGNHAANEYSNGHANGTTPNDGRTFTVSFFPKLDKARGRQESISWPQLRELFATCDIRAEKDGPLISGAIYNPEEVQRKNANVLAVSLLLADCDESYKLAELRELIENTGARAILFSTHSHGTPDTKNHPDANAPGERYRVIFPLEEEIAAGEYPTAWERFNLLFHGEIDVSCKEVSRAFFLPSHPTGKDFVFEVFDGPCLRIEDLPELPQKFDHPTCHPSGTSTGSGLPGNDYNARATNEDTAQILEAHGWSVTRSVSGRWKARRPGKTGPGISATIGHYGPGVLHVFSSNAAPFEAGRAYKPFQVLALLDHAQDFSAAAKSLGQAGYGEKTISRKGELDHEEAIDSSFGGFGGREVDEFEYSRPTSDGKKKEELQGIGQYTCVQLPENLEKPDTTTRQNIQNPEKVGGIYKNSKDSTRQNIQNPTFDSPPQSLATRLRPVPLLDPALIPAPFRAWLQDIAERQCVPLDYPAAAAMVAVSSVVGRSIGIRPKRFDDWSVTPNLWGALVGPPGVQKSPASGEAMKPLNRLVAEAMSVHEEEKKGFTADELLNKARSDAAKRKLTQAASSGKTTECELRLLAAEAAYNEEQTAPTLRRYIVNDSTVEALGERLKENPRGVLLERDELTGFFKSLDKQGHEGDRSFYLEAWNGNGTNYMYDRIGRGTVKIPAVCVSIFGTIQPGPLSRYTRAAASGDSADGLLPRFQILVYPDMPAYQRVDRWPNAEAKDAAYAIFKALDTLNPETIGAEFEDGAPCPFLRFAPDAQAFFNGWLDDMEERLRSGQESDLMQAHLAKYRSLMPSLALLFHLVEVVSSDKSGGVCLESARRAAAWCDYLEAHARRIYQLAHDPDTEAASVLADRLKELPNPFKVSTIPRKGWSKLTTGDDVWRAVDFLELRNWVKVVKLPPSEAGGRPTADVYINPEALGDASQ